MSSNKVLWAVGLGLVGFGFWSYFGNSREAAADEKEALKNVMNPWAGSNTACEAAFNKLPAKDQKDLAEFIRTSSASGQGSDENVRNLVKTSLGLSKLDCNLPMYLDVRS